MNACHIFPLSDIPGFEEQDSILYAGETGFICTDAFLDEWELVGLVSPAHKVRASSTSRIPE